MLDVDWEEASNRAFSHVINTLQLNLFPSLLLGTRAHQQKIVRGRKRGVLKDCRHLLAGLDAQAQAQEVATTRELGDRLRTLSYQHRAEYTTLLLCPPSAAPVKGLAIGGVGHVGDVRVDGLSQGDAALLWRRLGVLHGAHKRDRLVCKRPPGF